MNCQSTLCINTLCNKLLKKNKNKRKREKNHLRFSCLRR